MKLHFLLFLFLASVVFSQTNTTFEENLDTAIQNAKKGIYWALDNIPRDKKKLDNDLISNDNLIARIDLYKEVEGVRVVSTGYNGTYTVTIEVYRSYDSLEKEKGE
ncbi:MAG: hypothetical protein PVH88_17085 [Ignavibacteria bacterium]|jgi:hypothetical protein